MASYTVYSPANSAQLSRSTLWATALVVAAFAAAYLPVVHSLASVAPLASTPVAHVRSAATPASKSKAPVSASAAAAIPTPQNCTTLTSGQPSQLELSGATNGLTTRTDAATYYQIYGYTADQLRNQIQHCAPGAGNGSLAEFTGETNYSLDWSYNYTTLANDSCSLGNIKVGIHTAMALPAWQTNTTTPGLADRWTQFSSALASHEQGHVAIDKLYAAKLVTDLTALPAMACSQLASSANGIIQNDVAALNQANTDYDSQTNHGATQGAVLPTH